MHLFPHEIIPARLCDATGLALFISKRANEVFLVTEASDDPSAITLSSPNIVFGAVSLRNLGTSLVGLLVPGVTIELDITKISDPDRQDLMPGTLVRVEDRLEIVVKEPRFSDTFQVFLMGGLPVSPGGRALGITSWSVLIGSAEKRRVLKSVDLSS